MAQLSERPDGPAVPGTEVTLDQIAHAAVEQGQPATSKAVEGFITEDELLAQITDVAADTRSRAENVSQRPYEPTDGKKNISANEAALLQYPEIADLIGQAQSFGINFEDVFGIFAG